MLCVQICQKHNIIILEDDAYYWLQYPQGTHVPESEQPGGVHVRNKALCRGTDVLGRRVQGQWCQGLVMPTTGCFTHKAHVCLN